MNRNSLNSFGDAIDSRSTSKSCLLFKLLSFFHRRLLFSCRLEILEQLSILFFIFYNFHLFSSKFRILLHFSSFFWYFYVYLLTSFYVIKKGGGKYLKMLNMNLHLIFFIRHSILLSSDCVSCLELWSVHGIELTRNTISADRSHL